MPKQSRNSTRHSGVFFVELVSGDQTFFIRYKKDIKLIEERAGRKSQGWTAGVWNGQGTYTWSNGNKGVGEYRNGKDWNTTRYDKHGNILGKYVEGVRQ